MSFQSGIDTSDGPLRGQWLPRGQPSLRVLSIRPVLHCGMSTRSLEDGPPSQCKTLLALIPPPNSEISHLGASELVDLICSPSGRFPDTSKAAATALLCRVEELPLSAEKSMHALKGCLNILERFGGEHVDAAGALGEVMLELLDPISATSFIDEDGVSTVLHALRAALNLVPSGTIPSQGGCESAGAVAASACSEGSSLRSSDEAVSVVVPVGNGSDVAASFFYSSSSTWST